MRVFTSFLTGICLLSMIAVAAVACGDDDDTSGAAKTVNNAQTAVATNAQGVASAVASSVQNAGSAVAGSATAASSSENEQNIGVTEKDFSIKLDNATTSGGKVDFKIHNDGPSTHEFVVFKTDLAEDKLPMDKDGTKVNEDDPSLNHIDEKEDIAQGADVSLDIDNLAPGHYVLICNIAGHYQLGMHTSLTVK